jgi:hypothetical protein
MARSICYEFLKCFTDLWISLYCAVFPFHDFSYSNYIFNFPSKCTSTIEYFYCLLNICHMFRSSLRHHQGELFITSQMKSEEIKKIQEEIPISTNDVFVLRFPVLSVIWQPPGQMCILCSTNSLNHCGNCTYQLDWSLSTLRRYDDGLCEEYSMMIYETGSDLGLQRVEWLWLLPFRKHLFYTVYWTLMGFMKTLAFDDGTVVAWG